MDENDQVALAVPAIRVNRFRVFMGPDGARIVFGERVPDREHYHAAVHMSGEDLIELSQVISKVADDYAKALAEAKKKAN